MRATVARLRQAGILASLFIDPDPKQIEAAHEVGAQQVELCTAAYAEATLGARGIHGEGALRVGQELRRLREGAALATQYGLLVAAGHGLTYRNVGAVAAISEDHGIQHRPQHYRARNLCWVGTSGAEMREAISGEQRSRYRADESFTSSNSIAVNRSG